MDKIVVLEYPHTAELANTVDYFSGFRFSDKHPSPAETDHSSDQLLMIWSNRLHNSSITKPNPPDVTIKGKKYRFQFTTYAKASASTLVRLYAAFKSWNSAKAVADANNLRMVAYEDLAALERFLPKTGNLIRDVAYVSPNSLVDAYSGFILDHEVQDNRPNSVSANLFKRLAADFPGLRRHLYTNAPASSSFNRSGLGDIKTSLASFHAVSLLVSSDTPAITTQHAVYGGAKKIIVTVDLSLPLSALKPIRTYVAKNGLLGVHLWKNGQDPLTALGKQKVNLFKDF